VITSCRWKRRQVSLHDDDDVKTAAESCHCGTIMIYFWHVYDFYAFKTSFHQRTSRFNGFGH
jgi:hypothetical protein